MIAPALRFGEAVLRGYGQLFLCNRAGSGTMFLLGLCIVSPGLAGWSLMGAALVTVGAWLGNAAEDAESGLFGVNGALLGLSWGLFPEISTGPKLLMTIAGSVLIVLVLVPSIRFFRTRRLGLTLFAIPYLLAVWMNVVVAQQMGWYDAGMLRGWNALAAKQPAEAGRHFSRVAGTTSPLCAYQHDGWGWAEFRQQRFAEALDHFAEAQRRKPELADAATGAGWSAYRLGRRDEARRWFQIAVAQDPRQANAWDGLGWLDLDAGDPRASLLFRQCLAQLPFLQDARAGQARALALSDPLASAWHARMAQLASDRISPGWQQVSSAQWLCWLLFLAGIAWHSRTLLCVTFLSLAGYAALIASFGTLQKSLEDPLLLFNLLPIWLALGGQYLRLSIRSFGWILFLTALVIACWSVVSSAFLAMGVPILSLPFHAALLGTLVAFRGFAWGRDLLVPLEIATTSPEEVRIWQAQQSLARECWERLTLAPAATGP